MRVDESQFALRRGRTRWVGVVALLAVAALVLSVGAGSAARTPDPVLLKAYQPVLVLHPDEAFLPAGVQSFVTDARLELLVGADPLLDSSWAVVDSHAGPGSLPGPAAAGVYRLNQISCTAAASLGGLPCYASSWLEGHGARTVYGRVWRSSGAIVLQYWLFYYDNTLVLDRQVAPPPAPPVQFWQAHESDWEVVNVVLDTEAEPSYVGYSRHCSGARKNWSSVSTWDGTHPVVYVALGSHANYFEPGSHLIDVSCVPEPLRPYYGLLLPNDLTAPGSVIGPPGSGAVAAIHSMPDPAKGWTGFAGRWGETEYLHTPVSLPSIPAGTYAAGLAPVGPAYHAVWTDPLTTMAGWPLEP